MMCHVLIHPRVPVLASSISIIQQKETISKLQKLPEVILGNDNQERNKIDKILDQDKSLPFKSKQTEKLDVFSLNSNEEEREDNTQKIFSTTSVTLTKNSCSTTKNEEVQKCNRGLLNDIQTERPESASTKSALLTTLENLDDRTVYKSSENGEENPVDNTNKIARKKFDENASENSDNIASDLTDSLRLDGQCLQVEDSENNPPVKKRKTSAINTSNLEKVNVHDSYCSMETNGDKRNIKEMPGLDEVK